jgi:hypothetical protein
MNMQFPTRRTRFGAAPGTSQRHRKRAQNSIFRGVGVMTIRPLPASPTGKRSRRGMSGYLPMRSSPPESPAPRLTNSLTLSHCVSLTRSTIH